MRAGEARRGRVISGGEPFRQREQLDQRLRCGRRRNVRERVGRLVWYGIAHTAQDLTGCKHCYQPTVISSCDNSICWNPSPFMQMKKLREVSGKMNSYRLLSTKYRPCILCAYGISFNLI